MCVFLLTLKDMDHEKRQENTFFCLFSGKMQKKTSFIRHFFSGLDESKGLLLLCMLLTILPKNDHVNILKLTCHKNLVGRAGNGDRK